MGAIRKGAVVLLFLVLFGMGATPATGTIAGPTYDVVLSDNGPTFYDNTVVGEWPYYYPFEMKGRVESYSTSWYSGSGTSHIAVIVLGTYDLDYASAKLTNTAGYSMYRTYSSATFTANFYYPFLDDADGGPSSTLTMRWHYKFIGGGGY